MIKLFWAIAMLVLGATSLAYAQPNQAKAPARVPYSAARSTAANASEGLIKLDVLVVDKNGQPVSGLTRADFNLFEEGREQKILSFQAFSGQGTGSEPPVKIILLIDTIGLPGPLVGEERSAVETYLRQNHGRLAHPVSVYLLDDSGLRMFAPSTDGEVLASEVGQNQAAMVRPVGRRPALGAGKAEGSLGLPEPPVLTAMKALGQIAAYERTQPGRKVLVWVGPGGGVGSANYNLSSSNAPRTFYLVCWFSILLREARLALYNFNVEEVPAESTATDYGTFLKGVRYPKQASLKNISRNVLAVQSGGAVMGSMDLAPQIERCVQQTGPFYRISFNPFPAEHADEYHDLKAVIDRPKLTARTNTGYYDQPFYSLDPVHPLRQVSAQEIEDLLASSHGESDAKFAEELSGLQLTERLSEGVLARLETKVRGKKARQELQILADVSGFMDPPKNEIPADAPPTPETQRHMLSLTSEYLSNTIRRLPNFFARQTSVHYGMTPEDLTGGANVHYQPLHLIDRSTASVYYRDGREVTDTKGRKRDPGMPASITYGVFGPVLAAVFDAIDKSGGLTWSRWEQNAADRVAVFRYVVPPDKSPYEVQLCCIADGDGTEAFKKYVGYHGELAIDPESGAVLRLEFNADLPAKAWVARSGIVVQYGKVEIGDKFYTCPLKSVSIMRVRYVQVLAAWNEAFRTYGPYTTMLDDIRFDRYHAFEAPLRILPGFTPVK